MLLGLRPQSLPETVVRSYFALCTSEVQRQPAGSTAAPEAELDSSDTSLFASVPHTLEAESSQT